MSALLEVEDLGTWFYTRQGIVKAVDGVDFEVASGETLAIVGESGCGKSMTALSLMRLIPDPPGRIVSGAVKLAGRNLLKLSEEEMRRVRGNDISMIFQEPMTSLNPVMTIGKQIAEALILHRELDRKAATKRVIEMLDLVRIPEPKQRAKEYPHQLSCGMRQRAMIAMALACNPKVLIADEPTTALDVTIQAQILDLMRGLRRDTGTAIILITHDLGVVAEMADDVAVMYAGQIVERAPVTRLFTRPEHPYTVSVRPEIEKMLYELAEGGEKEKKLGVQYRAKKVELGEAGSIQVSYDFEGEDQQDAFESIAEEGSRKFKGRWRIDRGAMESSSDASVMRWKTMRGT